MRRISVKRRSLSSSATSAVRCEDNMKKIKERKHDSSRLKWILSSVKLNVMKLLSSTMNSVKANSSRSSVITMLNVKIYRKNYDNRRRNYPKCTVNCQQRSMKTRVWKCGITNLKLSWTCTPARIIPDSSTVAQRLLVLAALLSVTIAKIWSQMHLEWNLENWKKNLSDTN